MNKKQYQKYLKSSHWREKRREKLDGIVFLVCHICRSGENFHIHHLTYERIGQERGKDIVRLCPSCHRLIHQYAIKLNIFSNNKRANKRLLQGLRLTRDGLPIKKMRKKGSDGWLKNYKYPFATGEDRFFCVKEYIENKIELTPAKKNPNVKLIKGGRHQVKKHT